jgi:hypothetical protein
MTEVPAIGRATTRELAHRETTHLQVSLLWHPTNNLLTLRLVEVGTGREYTFCIKPEKALDAFNHPYAYLPIPPLKSPHLDTA